MANGKKSFILYCDMKHTVDLLDDASAGKLLKHLLAYVNDENPQIEDPILKIAFEPIKQQLKRDLKDWEKKREKRVESGHLGGIKSGESRRLKQTKQMLQNGSKTKQTKANEAVNVNANVTVNGINTEPLPKMTGQDFIDFKAKLKEDRIFIEPLLVTKIRADDLDRWINQFHVHIAGEEKLNKDYKDYKKHFKNWLNKQDTTIAPTLLPAQLNGKSTPAYIKSEKDTNFDKYRKNGV